MVLSVQNLRVQYGARVLFNDLSFTVEDGERIALAGHNGAGKSTLMKCIAGLNEPDSGSIIKSRHSQVGYLPQEGIHIRGRRLIDEAMSAFADLMDLQERIDVLTREMAGLDPRSAAYSEVLNEIGELELVLHAHNSARLRPRTESILRGLGFKDRDFDRDCGEFSGGWQMRIALAKLLLREPEVLLLDEPTNHLDAKARKSVAAYLKKKKGFILVSHDRRFLDDCVDYILSINRANIEVQRGNFSSWMSNFERQQEFELAQNERLQKDIRRLQQSAKRAAVWSERVEASKIGAADKGYVGHKAAKMMKRSKSIEARQQQTIEQKSALLKNMETAEALKIQPLNYHTDLLASLSNLSLIHI